MLEINGKKVHIPENAQIVSIAKNSWELHLEHNIYTIELLEYKPENQSIKLFIDGHYLELEVKDEWDQLIAKMGWNKAQQRNDQSLKAPMPGKILALKAFEGQEVQKGSPLIVLEAMKMENVIMSPVDGVIKEWKVKAEDNVAKDEVLMYFE